MTRSDWFGLILCWMIIGSFAAVGAVHWIQYTVREYRAVTCPTEANFRFTDAEIGAIMAVLFIVTPLNVIGLVLGSIWWCRRLPALWLHTLRGAYRRARPARIDMPKAHMVSDEHPITRGYR